MNVKSKILLIILISILIFAFISNYSFLKTEEAIRKSVLKSMPLGTSFEKAKMIVIDKKWNIVNERQELPFELARKDYPFVSGSSIIVAIIGKYLGGYAYIEVFLGFDDSDNLIDVKIRKTYE